MSPVVLVGTWYSKRAERYTSTGSLSGRDEAVNMHEKAAIITPLENPRKDASTGASKYLVHGMFLWNL